LELKVYIRFGDTARAPYESGQVPVGFRMALRGMLIGESVSIALIVTGFRNKHGNPGKPLTLDQFADLIPIAELVAMAESLIKAGHHIPTLWIAEYLRHAERES
jgi:hypothetical protein